jgi:hypothetical protein
LGMKNIPDIRITKTKENHIDEGEREERER